VRASSIGRWLIAVALLAGATTAARAADPPLPLPKPPVPDLRLAEHPEARTAALPDDNVARLLRAALARGDKYLLNTWWNEYMLGVAPYAAAGQRAATTSTIDSEEVRRYSSAAYALAVSLTTGAYDEKLAGVPTLLATERTVELVRYVTSTHVANTARLGWGGSVQSGLWASQIAQAGWLLGDAVTPPTQVLLGRMLAYEADAITGRDLHYYRNRHGEILTPGNSGAEDLAWDGSALWTAVELLPHDYRRPAWADAAYRRLVGAYARPVDTRSSRVVNGHSLRSWLGGSNVEPSGFVVNHGRIHPDYTKHIGMWAAPVSALVGDGVPAAMLEGVGTTYRALTTYRFAGPPYAAPGGTVYRPGTPTVYYPKGPDWGTHCEASYGALDVQVAALGPGSMRANAARWAVAHLTVVRRMQDRYTTGQTYGPAVENHYRAREEHNAMVLGVAYLTWWLRTNGGFTVDTKPPASKMATW
jgi:hypothetical protein